MPLHLACEGGYTALAVALLEAGATLTDVSYAPGFTNPPVSFGQAWDHAHGAGHFDLARLLLRAGARHVPRGETPPAMRRFGSVYTHRSDDRNRPNHLEVTACSSSSCCSSSSSENGVVARQQDPNEEMMENENKEERAFMPEITFGDVFAHVDLSPTQRDRYEEAWWAYRQYWLSHEPPGKDGKQEKEK